MKTDILILQEMEETYGNVTPERVVQDAHAAEHPWHSRFNWNDQTAAHQHRLDQARLLIRGVRYEVRIQNRVLSTVAYIRDPDAPGDEQAYVSVAKIKSDEDRARSAVLAEFSRVASALKRARDLAAVLGLNDRIEEAIGQIEALALLLRQPAVPGPEARQ